MNEDPDLLITAFKHRSYLNITNEERIASNERLEFLGDAVLDLVVTQYLYQKFPKRAEGQLSKIKSILVSKPAPIQLTGSEEGFIEVDESGEIIAESADAEAATPTPAKKKAAKKKAVVKKKAVKKAAKKAEPAAEPADSAEDQPETGESEA